MDDGVTLRPPPVCTGRGGRWCTHGVGNAYAPCSPVALHALWRLLDGRTPLPTRFGVRRSQSEDNEVLVFLNVTVLATMSGDGQDEGSSRFRHAFGLYRTLRHANLRGYLGRDGVHGRDGLVGIHRERSHVHRTACRFQHFSRRRISAFPEFWGGARSLFVSTLHGFAVSESRDVSERLSEDVQKIDGCSIIFSISRPMGLYASLRHPLRIEVVVVARSTRHDPDFGPLFLGLLFRHGLTYFS